MSSIFWGFFLVFVNHLPEIWLLLLFFQNLLVFQRVQPANCLRVVVPRLHVNHSIYSHQRGVQHIIIHSIIIRLHHVIQELRHASIHLRFKHFVEMLFRPNAQRPLHVLLQLQRQLHGTLSPHLRNNTLPSGGSGTARPQQPPARYSPQKDPRSRRTWTPTRWHPRSSTSESALSITRSFSISSSYSCISRSLSTECSRPRR